MAKNETVLKIRADIENLQGLNRLKSAIRRASAEAKGADNDFRSLVGKVKELQAASVRSINNLNAQKDAFQALRRSVDLASKEYKDIGDEINKIDNELKEAQGTIVSYSKNSINALRAQKKELLAVRDAADVMSDEFKKAGVELAKLDKKLAKAEGRRAGGGGGRLGAAAQIAGTVAGAGVFGGPEGAIGAALGALAGPQGAIVGGAIGAQVGQLRKAAGGVAEYTAELNLAKATLAGVSTDLAEYNKNLEFAREISGNYAIRLKDVVTGYASVTAAARANNLSIKDTQSIYEGITASGVAFGKSQEDLQALFLATTQVLSKGKASAEEISGQIGERIPGAVAKFAEATNRTLPQLAKAFQDGEVTIADFVLFAQKQGEDYADFAKSLAEGPEKAGLRLQIALDNAMEKFGGFFLDVGAGFQDYLTNLVNFVVKNEKQFKLLIAKTIVFAQDFVNIFVEIGKGIWRVFGPLFKLIGNTIVDLTRGLSDMVKQGQIERAAREKGIGPRRSFALRREAEEEIALEEGGRNKLDLGQSERINTRYYQKLAELAGVAPNTSRANRVAEILKRFGDYTPERFGGVQTGGNQTAPSDVELDGGSRGRGIDAAARAAQRVEALRLKLSRGLENLGIKIKGIGTTAEEAIQTKYETALNNARFATEDFKRTIDEAAKTTKVDYSELIKLVEQYETAVVTAADAERRAALGKLREKAFGEDLRRRYGLSPEILEGNVFGSIDTQAFPTGIDSILNPNKIKENINEIKTSLAELVDPVNQVTSAANTIGTAFTDSFTSVINGSATTQEALANFFGNIGKYFLDMAAQIIQKMITMAILNQVVGLLPGLGSSASSFNLNGFGNLGSDAGSGVSGFLAGASGILGKANGGPVNANQPYIVGERGPELFVPFQQGSITSNEALQQAATTQVPFTRNAESVTQAQETAQAMRAAGPIEVRYESNVINGVEYVTAEQHRKGMAQAAERGRSLTIQALQNSVKTRGRVGL